MLKNYISSCVEKVSMAELSRELSKVEYKSDQIDKSDFYQALLECREEENQIDQEDKEEVFSIDGMRLFHYHAAGEKKCATPLLVTYALINRQYMMDLQPDRSVIKKFIDGGLDVYSIDWGYPTAKDMHITMDDYVNRYMDACVDFIAEKTGFQKINLLGVCQGGTFSVIYTSLHQHKIKNLITMVVPIDFDSKDALLFRWCKKVDVEGMVRAYGLVSGDYLNHMFLYMKPFELNVDKYRSLVRGGYKKNFGSFLRMERWTFDCPNESGAMLIDCMDGLFKKNLLYKGELTLNGREINAKHVTCPILCICGKKDHIVPLSASEPLMDLIGSEDKEFVSFDTGHIGMYVSTSSQNSVSPKILDWIQKHE